MAYPTRMLKFSRLLPIILLTAALLPSKMWALTDISCSSRTQEDSLFAADRQHLRFDPQTGIPTPPAHCTTRQEKAGFIARNWWRNTQPGAFTHDILSENSEAGEQKIVDFLSLLPLCDSTNQQRALCNLLAFSLTCDAADSTYNRVNDILEKYLWDEESPMYDEELFIFVLRYRAARPDEEEGSKIRATLLLPQLLKNRIGQHPNDLALGLPDGSETRLSQVLAETSGKPFTLLVFYDLDCVYCQELIEEISRTPEFSPLRIITIQLQNQDPDAWKTYIGHLPSDWTHTYDSKEAVLLEETFYLRNSSALYLLDNRGNILRKNTSIPAIKELLSTQTAGGIR